jgi:ElaB/YqjD/DUF883 family membrane-anchored ribosome-binding protein
MEQREQRTETQRSPELERFIEDLKAVVRDGQELLQSSVAGIKGQAMDKARAAEQCVHQNPYRSMGIVFGLGILVGVLAVGLCRKDE